MQPQPERVAARLGLDESMSARLRAGGQLERLALTEPEIRERLHHAHLAYLRAQTAIHEAAAERMVVGSCGRRLGSSCGDAQPHGTAAPPRWTHPVEWCLSRLDTVQREWL
jgi:hypothetical protein